MLSITVIKKRNGSTVLFEKPKIEHAIRKAFLAVTREEKEHIAIHIAALVEKELELEMMTKESYLPTVEHTQDLVEKHLMAAGFFDVAKAYIIYRYERSKVREEKKKEDLEKLEDNVLMIVKKGGKRERFDVEKIRKSLSYVTEGYENKVDINQIIEQLKLEVFDGMSTEEINKSVVMIIRAMIERHPAYSYVASRLLLRQVNEEVIGERIHYGQLDEQYREAFKKGIRFGVERKLLDSRMALFDLDLLAKSIDRSRDNMFMFLGTQTLSERYLVRDTGETGKLIETVQGFWMRIAMGIALGEKEADRNTRAIEFYETMSTMRFVPSSPTLFHAGTAHPQLSSCYLNTVGDSLESIFKVYADNAQLSKWAGGIGTNWTHVRASGALVKKSGIKSNGLVPFLKIANDVTVAINRSGRRRGATCVYIENWHYDVDEFLELRKNTGDDRRRTHDMNTALWVSDLFMKRVREDGPWTLFSPDETGDLADMYGAAFEKRYVHYEEEAARGTVKVFKTLQARDLWRKMITMLYETGHPWITWKDPSNIRSPQDHAGVVHNSNLCTEITLNNSLEETAVCNLGSLNYQRLMRGSRLDVDLVASTVRTAVRMLDNVIDINYYPTIEAKNSNLRHRPIGLGVMGFHDALYMMNINFDSEDAIRFADESMELISYHTILASSELARERGSYESYDGSKWSRNLFPVDTIRLLEKERGIDIPISTEGKLDWTMVRNHVRQYGMRNSNTMAIAPTATISNIVGSTPTIEPLYKNIFVKANMNGDFIVMNPYLVEDLEKIGLWDFEMIGKLKYFDGSVKDIVEIPAHIREKYKEVFEINPEWLIRAAAARGKWIDQSQSLNIYFAGSSGKELASIYDFAWSQGLKTTYYLRTLGASQVEKSTVSTNEFGVTHKRDTDTQSSVQAPIVSPISVLVEEKVAVAVAAQSSPTQDIATTYNEPVVSPLQMSSMRQSLPAFENKKENISKEIQDKTEDQANTTLPPKRYNITVLPEATCDGCQ